jgi:hypothetical protein
MRFGWKRKSGCFWYSFWYCGMRMMNSERKNFLVRNDLEMTCRRMTTRSMVMTSLMMKICKMRMA